MNKLNFSFLLALMSMIFCAPSAHLFAAVSMSPVVRTVVFSDVAPEDYEPDESEFPELWPEEKHLIRDHDPSKEYKTGNIPVAHHPMRAKSFKGGSGDMATLMPGSKGNSVVRGPIFMRNDGEKDVIYRVWYVIDVAE